MSHPKKPPKRPPISPEQAEQLRTALRGRRVVERRCQFRYSDGELCLAMQRTHDALDRVLGDWFERHDFKESPDAK